MDRERAAQRKVEIEARLVELDKEQTQLLIEHGNCVKVLNNSDVALNMYREEERRIRERQERNKAEEAKQAELNRQRDEELHKQRQRERETQNRQAEYISRVTGH